MAAPPSAPSADARRRLATTDAADAAPAPPPPAPPSARLRSQHGLTFLHVSLADWLLGAAASVAFVLFLQASPLPLAPLALGFDLAPHASQQPPPLRLWPPASPAGAAPPPLRALLEGRAGLFALGSGAPAPPLLPLALPLPFMPLPRALRANASVALELVLLRGSAEAAAAAELCVSVEDARGEDITPALTPFAAEGDCGAPHGRRLAFAAGTAAPPALAVAAAAFALPPGARLGVTLAGSGGLGGELRLSVAAAAGGYAFVVR